MRKEGSSLPIDVIPFGGRTQAGKKEPHHPSPLLPSHSPRPGEERPSSPRPSSPAPSPPSTPGEEGAQPPHHPSPLLPSHSPNGRRERKARTLQPGPLGAPASRRLANLPFSLFSRRTGGRLGEEGRGDEDSPRSGVLFSSRFSFAYTPPRDARGPR